MRKMFDAAAESAARAMGTFWAFLLASLVVVVWACTGPFCNFSDSWQLIINTGTTIVTFLMVFLIQNTHDRETRVLSQKLDELLRRIADACIGSSFHHRSDVDLQDEQAGLLAFPAGMGRSSMTIDPGARLIERRSSGKACRGTGSHQRQGAECVPSVKDGGGMSPSSDKGWRRERLPSIGRGAKLRGSGPSQLTRVHPASQTIAGRCA